MDLLSELPLDAQFAVATTLLGKTSEGWATAEQLAQVTVSTSVQDAFEAVTEKLISRQSGNVGDGQMANIAQETLATVSKNARTAGVLSGNEEVDEIPTTHLKYLLLPFLTALSHAAWQGEQELRLQHLTTASHHIAVFLSAMENARLLKEEERERLLDGNKTSLTPMQARDEKIQRFKAEKQVEGTLKALVARLGTAKDQEDDGDFEDATREATLILLRSAVTRTHDVLNSISKEVELLSWAEAQRAKGTDPRERAQRARGSPEVSSIPGMPPTFRILSKRELEKEKVFRPSHSLPTYTVEQWGEIQAQILAEKHAQNIGSNGISARRAEPGESNSSHFVDDDNDDEDSLEQKTLEQRRWDDWKDDHNKGSGNSMR